MHWLRTKGATGSLALGAPLFPNVELAGFVQSTWKAHIRMSKPVSPGSVGGTPTGSSTSANQFGEPDGGSDEPSRSPGSIPMYWPPGGLWFASSKKTTRAGWPCSILLRSNANTPVPDDVTEVLGNSLAIM